MFRDVTRGSGKFLIITLLICLFFIFTLPSAEAHVLIIADGDSSNPEVLTEAKNTASALESKGYKVLKLYQKNATTKKIMKGMYRADAVIYVGHGGYQSGHYNGNGGKATPPYALVGSNDFVWGVNTKIREGFNGKTVTAPFKSKIPVILAHTCFSTGYVGNKQVSNPVETIYNFSQMFTGAGANYYATGYYGSYKGKNVVDIVDDFLNGATSFTSANNKNSIKVSKSYTFNGKKIWRSTSGYAAFVGDWNGTFPKASQTTAYSDSAAEAWYQAVVLGKDKTAPTVKSTNPKKGATGVPLTTSITITFSENIWSSTNFSGIYIKNLNTGKKVGLTKSISGKTLTLKMTANRIMNNLYQVYIPASAVRDIASNKLKASYTFQFRTRVT